MLTKSIPAMPGGVATHKVQKSPSHVNANPLASPTDAMGAQPHSVNLDALTRLISDELLISIDAGQRDLEDISAIFKIIERLATSRAEIDLLSALGEIRHLARMAGYVADDTANLIDCSQERFRTAAADMGVKL